MMLDSRAGAPLGSERYVDFVFQPITGEDGAVTGIFVEAHDVTERKRAEAALRESEARFRLVAENAPVMLWMGDADRRRALYLNAAQRAFWGVAPRARRGLRLEHHRASRRPRDACRRPFEKAMREHTPFASRCRLRRADGVPSASRPAPSRGSAADGRLSRDDRRQRRRHRDAARPRRRSAPSRRGWPRSTAPARRSPPRLDADRIVQLVSDACVALIGAEFGAFFYNVVDDEGERYTLYALSGAKREAFDGFPMPRATAVFQPTFRGEGIIRSDDILEDPRYGAERAVPRHARGAPAGAELPGGAGGLALGRGDRRAVLRPRRGRGLHRAARGDRRRHRRAGGDRDRQRAALRGGRARGRRAAAGRGGAAGAERDAGGAGRRRGRRALAGRGGAARRRRRWRRSAS